MTEARTYQTTAVDDLRDAVIEHRSVVYVLPTGGGKTVVAAKIAALAAAKGSRTLFLVHRRELVRQALDTLTDAVEHTKVGVEAAGYPQTPWAQLVVGMVTTIVRRDNVGVFDLVIVDEAHHARAATWEKVLARWPNAAKIGLTATPERLDGKGLGMHFNAMVQGPSIPELIDDGYLAPGRVLRLPTALRLDGLKKDRHGEYRVSDMGDRVTGRVVASAVDAYMRYAHPRKAIFFGVHRDHSRQVCATLCGDRGVNAAHVDGTDHPARRDRIMMEFQTGGIQVVGNCELINEGFDAPACECVILGRHTASVTRYLQSVGRAMRPGPGKEYLVLDLTGVSHDLGLPDDVREWSLEDGEVRGDGSKQPPPKTCEKCRTQYRGPACPYCGHQTAPSPVNEVETELEEATKNGRPKRGNRAELYKETAAAKRSADPKAALLDIAKRRGYNPRWADHILRAWNMKETRGINS